MKTYSFNETEKHAFYNSLHQEVFFINTKVNFMSELGLHLGKTQERQKLFVQLSSQKEEVKCEFGSKLKSQLILLFNLFLLLFMNLTVFFGTIYGFIILFQLTFTFICSIFSKKISVLAK